MSWSAFAASAPELARFGEERLNAAPAYLATVTAAGGARVHPVTPIIGRALFLFMEPTSPKGRDLRERAFYALHSAVPDSSGAGGEFFLSGTAVERDDAELRREAAEVASYQPEERYVLFELLVARATKTVYEEGEPKRTHWSATVVSSSAGVVAAVDHVQLAMPAGEEASAVAFYSGLLGIPEVPKPAHLAARGGCWFERGPLKVHLGVEKEFRPAGKAHPALRIRGLPELVARLREGGVEVVDDEPLEGYDRVYVHDPFGNRIELLEPH